jgi:hypothetical protein
MPKRCPPGVICFENVTVVCILAVTFLAVIVFVKNKDVKPQQQRQLLHLSRPDGLMQIQQPDVLFDAYEPPLRDDRYFFNAVKEGGGRGIPINIRTQGPRGGRDAEYRQVGILTKGVGGDSILPLMGKPLLLNRDKWNFYTMNDKNNMIKLPIRVNGKSGTSEYGCDDVSTGDTVFVEGYKEAFKVTAYDNDVIRYMA